MTSVHSESPGQNGQDLTWWLSWIIKRLAGPYAGVFCLVASLIYFLFSPGPLNIYYPILNWFEVVFCLLTILMVLMLCRVRRTPMKFFAFLVCLIALLVLWWILLYRVPGTRASLAVYVDRFVHDKDDAYQDQVCSSLRGLFVQSADLQRIEVRKLGRPRIYDVQPNGLINAFLGQEIDVVLVTGHVGPKDSLQLTTWLLPYQPEIGQFHYYPRPGTDDPNAWGVLSAEADLIRFFEGWFRSAGWIFFRRNVAETVTEHDLGDGIYLARLIRGHRHLQAALFREAQDDAHLSSGTPDISDGQKATALALEAGALLLEGERWLNMAPAGADSPAKPIGTDFICRSVAVSNDAIATMERASKKGSGNADEFQVRVCSLAIQEKANRVLLGEIQEGILRCLDETGGPQEQHFRALARDRANRFMLRAEVGLVFLAYQENLEAKCPRWLELWGSFKKLEFYEPAELFPEKPIPSQSEQ